MKKNKTLVAVLVASSVLLGACTGTDKPEGTTDKADKSTSESTESTGGAKNTTGKSIELVLNHLNESEEGYSVNFVDKNIEEYAELGIDNANVSISSFVPKEAIKDLEKGLQYGQTYDVTFDKSIVTSIKVKEGADVWVDFLQEDKTNIIIVQTYESKLDSDIVNGTIQQFSSGKELNINTDYNIEGSVRDYTKHGLKAKEEGVLVFEGTEFKALVKTQEDLDKLAKDK